MSQLSLASLSNVALLHWSSCCYCSSFLLDGNRPKPSLRKKIKSFVLQTLFQVYIKYNSFENTIIQNDEHMNIPKLIYTQVQK